MSDAIYYVEVSGLDSAGSATVFRYATRSYTTPPSTSYGLNNTWLEGRLVQPLLMRRDMYGAGKTRGIVELGHGEIVLSNSDGGLDFLMNYGLDAQPVAMYRINSDGTRDMLFSGVTEQPELTTDALSLSVRDATYRLDQPLQIVKFLGNNIEPDGLEGTNPDGSLPWGSPLWWSTNPDTSAEGGAVMGMPKPKLYGRVENIRPVLVNLPRLIYQLHDTSVSTTITGTVLKVYDKRVRLTFGLSRSDAEIQAGATALTVVVSDLGTDTFQTSAVHNFTTGDAVAFTTDAALPAPLSDASYYYARVVNTVQFTLHTDAASATANTNRVNVTDNGTGTHTVAKNRTAQGCFDWCNSTALGFFIRLGTVPIGTVTADFNRSGATRIGQVVQEILTTCADGGGYTYVIANEIPLDASNDTYVCGAFFREETTTYEAIQLVAQSVNASFTVHQGDSPATGAGTVTVTLHRIDTPASSVLELGRSEIIKDSLRRGTSNDTDRGIPAWRVTVGYRRNYTIQDSGDIAGSDLSNLEFATQEYRVVTTKDDAIRLQYPAAPELKISTQLSESQAAYTLLSYLQRVYSTRRDVFVFDIPLEIFNLYEGPAPAYALGLRLNQTVTLTYPRFGLDAGKLVSIIGLQPNYEKKIVEVTVWG